MDVKQAEKIYKQHRLSAFSPKKLIVWITEETLKTLDLAKVAIQEKDYAEQNKQLQIAQQLVLEIIPSINSSTNTGQQLITILDYINRQLVEANMKRDISIVSGVETMLHDLRLMLLESL